MSVKVSKFAPKQNRSFHQINGINVAVTSCGLKKNKKKDLVLIKFSQPSRIFSFYTKSNSPGNPIIWNKSISHHSKISVLLINSGNANVFNGNSGVDAVRKIVDCLSEELHVKKEEIYLASTGIIGEKLESKKITDKIPFLVKNLSNKSKEWKNAANAIRTTDTFDKIWSLKKGSTKEIILNGIAKGSGMIAPNMATMLAFIFTNVQIEKDFNKQKIKHLVDQTFNSITVDSDTSTSDMVLIISVKQESKNYFKASSNHFNSFMKLLKEIMYELSHQIVKDGEGASKFITIHVVNAKNNLEAKKIAMSVANSPLFKTAMSSSDLNWGRILMAVGKSGAKINTNKISMKLGHHNILIDGNPVLRSETNVRKYLKKDEINISIDVGVASGSAKIFTCDLTHEYIKINSDYRS
tara:strand:+ start:970 stop:2199 length:1230 start_codon:yes stop_codon:yes gene_type:complete